MDKIFVQAKETAYGVVATFNHSLEFKFEIENILYPKTYLHKFIENNKDFLKNKGIILNINRKTTFKERIFFKELAKELKKRAFAVILSENLLTNTLQ